jgi:hypothetical protein
VNESVPTHRDALRRLFIERLVLVLVAGIIGLALLRATAPSVAFPGWDIDPGAFAGPVVGLGPTANLGVDLIMLTLSGAVLALAAVVGATLRWWRWCLFAAGLVAVAWHARFAPDAAHDHLTLGASWAAAMSACVAVGVAARFASVARLTGALLLGSIAVFAVKAGVQVFIENPQTIEMFKANREAMLAAQGWTSDSFAAKAFERRLYDAPGTGWLGLSNVLATAGACGAVASVAFIARGEARSLGVVAAGLASVAVLYFAESKGGWAAAALGIGVLAVWPQATRKRLGHVVLLLAMPLVALAAVALRGVIGERLGEFSLLFRSQYLAAAIRIIAEHPLAGVGPAGFKDAYLLAKSPLSPEEVSSPHSLFFDFVATLGVGGIAWSALLLSVLAAAGRIECGRPDEADADRLVTRLVLLTLALTTIAASWVELDVTSPSNVLVRVGGLVLASVTALAVVRANNLHAVRLAAALAAGVGLAHGMIEVSPVMAGSAPLLACLFGLGSATKPVPMVFAPRGAIARAAPGLALCVLGLVATNTLGPASAWEGLLRSSSTAMGRSTTLARALAEATDNNERTAALARLSQEIGREVPPTDRDVAAALQEIRVSGAASALQEIVAAIAIVPTHSETREAASRVALQLAALRPPNSDERRDVRQRAVQIAADATTLPLRRAASEAWLANVLRGAADLGGDPTLRREALAALERAAALDPRNPLHAANAARLANELHDHAAALRWAHRALELDRNMRLDPLRRFETAERARLESLTKPQ